MKVVTLIAACAIAAGCAGKPGGSSRALSYDWQTKHVEMPDDTYRLFTHPTDQTLLTSPSLGRAAQVGAATGATLYLGEFDPGAEAHRAAAQKWLNANRPGCTVISSVEIINLTYEHGVHCKNRR